MESQGSGDVFRKSLQNCALIKVEELTDEQAEVARENSLLSHKNTTFNEVNLESSIKEKKLLCESVVSIERLQTVVKVENNINVDRLSEQLSEEDYDYLIDRCNEKRIKEEHLVESEIIVQEEFDIKDEDEKPIKEEHLVELEIIVQEEFDIKDEDEETIKEKHLVESEIVLQGDFDIKDEDEETIKEHLVESEILVQEELDIKDEDEEDQFTTKSAADQTKKWHQASNKTSPQNGFSPISTNNHRLHLTQLPVFKCLSCTYQTHHKKCISSHVLNHVENILNCSHCSYKTKEKWRLRRHELVHSPKGELEVHQCPECPYQTKHRRYLMHGHMLIHKKDVPMHKCTLCPYENAQKINLTQHMQRVHRAKDSQPIPCPEDGCSFTTYNKSYLMSHIRMMHECKRFFKCPTCSFQTKYRKSLKAHELGHEDRSKWFSCTLCPYKATRRFNLNRHMLVH